MHSCIDAADIPDIGFKRSQSKIIDGITDKPGAE